MFFRKFSLPLAAFLLLSIAVLPSSSGADDALFVRAQGEIERLWSGVLGCAESRDVFTVRNRFDGFESTYGESVPAGGSSDYSECGKRALRNTGSRILVDTIEDALRQGGLALFDEGFQLDSSLNWVSEESSDGTIQGQVDAVIPFWSKNGQVIFTQPGLIFWTGLEEEERVDGNLGIVYRTNLTNTRVGIDAIGGASLFYDWDFHRVGHSRLGIGADIQSGIFHGAFNYYHPLSGDRDGQREGFIEKALRGMDLRLALERDTVRAGARLGYWRYEGGEDVTDEWRTSVGFDAGFRIVPGVFVEAEWEKHQEDVILDQRLSLGLAFRFSLPDFEGASYGNGGLSTNLYKVVDREKRILYEELEDIPRIRLTLQGGSQGGSSVAEGDTLIISGELVELAVPVMLDLVIDEDASSAELGSDKDFTYGYKVYEPDAGTGRQSAPDDATNCPNTMCEMAIPAGTTKFDIEMDILEDSDDKEVPEEIVLRIDVPEKYQRMIRGAEATVTIRAHGNSIGFAADAETMLAENNGTDGIQVSVNIDEPSPTPITLNVALSGTATVNEDYRIDTTILRIPANASSASLTLRGIDNSRGEGSKSIVLTISGNLPDGWVITDDEHEVTLSDDDLAVFFTSATPSSVDEPASDQSVTIEVGITQAPVADIKVMVAADTSASTAQASDYTFTATELTFSMGNDTAQTATLIVLHDTVPEGDETIVLTLADVGGSLTAGGNNFSLGDNHTITIPANDSFIRFATSSARMLNEADGMAASVVVEVVPPAPENITLSIATSGQAVEGEDYTISTKSLTIDAGESNGTIMLTAINDPDSEGNETIHLTLGASGTLPPGYTVNMMPHELMLIDDDLSVGFIEESVSVFEPGYGGSDSYTAMVALTHMPAENVSLTITPSGTATSGDYTLSTTMVRFAAGATDDDLVQPVTITINPDDVSEGDETVVLTLADQGGSLQNGENDFKIGRGTFTLTIPSNDNLVQFTEITGQGNLGEADGTRTRNLRVSIVDNPLPENANINIKTGGTATEGEDYNITVASPATASYASGVLTIPANEGQIDLTLTVIDDPADDWGVPRAGTGNMFFDDETIELILEDSERNLPVGWTINADKSTENFTIIDNDTGLFFFNRNPTTREGRFGIANASIVFSSPLAENVTIPLTVTGDSDAFELSVTVNRQKQIVTDSMVLPAGLRNVQLRVSTKDDPDTFNEIVTVTIDKDNLPPNFGTNEDNVWELEIRDKDGKTVLFSNTASTVTEGGSVSVDIQIIPDLDEDVAIPLRTTGDPDVYSLDASAPSSASVTRDGAVHTIDFIQSEDDDSVTLSFTAEEDDDRFDETVVFSLNQDDLPDGYNAERFSFSWRVSVTDNDKRIVSFADTSASVGEGGTVTTQIRVSEALAENVSIPLAITGNADVYRITAIEPAGASYSNGMVHFIQSEDADSVTLQFEAREDINGDSETITVAADADNMPPGYGVSESNNSAWEVSITDDDTIGVGFRWADSSPFRGRVSMRDETYYANLQLYISPPEAAQNAIIPIRVTGDPDAYYLTRNAPSGASFDPVVVPPPGAGRDQMFNVHFDSSGNAVTIAFHARPDVDYDRESIRIVIDGDSLPEGWYLGSGASSLDVSISDAQTRQFYFVGRRTIRDGLNPRVIPNVISYDNMKQGDYVDIEIRVRPPYPPGETFQLGPGGTVSSSFSFDENDDSFSDGYHTEINGHRIYSREYYFPRKLDNSTFLIRFRFFRDGLHAVSMNQAPTGATIGDPRYVNFVVE